MIKTENKFGSIILTEEFLANLAGYAATNCFGVVGMAATGPVDKLLSVVRHDRLSRGVRVRGNAECVDIDLHIIVSYGTNITAIVNSIAHKVRYTFEEMCGLKVRDVNTFVDGMKA